MELGHFILYRGRNRLNLARVAPGAYHEIVRDDGDLAYVQEDNIDGFLIRGGVHHDLCNISKLQSAALPREMM